MSRHKEIAASSDTQHQRWLMFLNISQWANESFNSKETRLMKKFELTSDMLTMSGTFYPKGYAFIMFPNATQAERAAFEIDNTSPPGDSLMFLNAATVLRDVGKVEGDSDIVLPSVGTEGATVRKYVDLARKGHCALMLKVDSDEETERVMQSARSASFSYGQRYHLLAMEDLE